MHMSIYLVSPTQYHVLYNTKKPSHRCMCLFVCMYLYIYIYIYILQSVCVYVSVCFISVCMCNCRFLQAMMTSVTVIPECRETLEYFRTGILFSLHKAWAKASKSHFLVVKFRLHTSNGFIQILLNNWKLPCLNNSHIVLKWLI